MSEEEIFDIFLKTPKKEISKEEFFLKTLKEIESNFQTLLENTESASHKLSSLYVDEQKKNVKVLKEALEEFDDDELAYYILEYYDFRNGVMGGELGNIFADTFEFIKNTHKLLPDYITDSLFSYIVLLPDDKLYGRLNRVLNKYLNNIYLDSKMVNASKKADVVFDAFYKAYKSMNNKIDDELIKYFLEHE
jgi:hypothetical protein